MVTPVNQVLTPYGKQIELPKMRPQAIALVLHGVFPPRPMTPRP